MTRNLYTEEPKNSIQLNAIYEMVSKISFDLVKNYENPEIAWWKLGGTGGRPPVDRRSQEVTSVGDKN